MKICPFCKNTVESGIEKCPYCNRILIERTANYISQNPNTSGSSHDNQKPRISIKEIISNKFKSLFSFFGRKPKVYRLNIAKENGYKKYVLLAALLLGVIIIASQKKNIPAKSDAPIPAIPLNNDIQKADIATPPKDPKTYVSLANGTIFTKNSNYLRGHGQLTIDNGTGSDAIAKLVSLSTNKSVYSVYIQANSTLVIDKISDGNYKLFFNLGSDWNKTNRAFAVNSSYEVFEETMNFITLEEADGYRYSTISVTLNPVAGGGAKTDSINPSDFGNY